MEKKRERHSFLFRGVGFFSINSVDFSSSSRALSLFALSSAKRKTALCFAAPLYIHALVDIVVFVFVFVVRVCV